MQPRNLLAVLRSPGDQASLSGILSGSAWRCRFVRTLPEVAPVLGGELIGVVVTDWKLNEPYGWENVLEAAQAARHPAKVIVADRLADEWLWAEVLNRGARDLLATPFARQEVLRVLQMAWMAWASEVTRGHAFKTSRSYLKGRSAGGWQVPSVS